MAKPDQLDPRQREIAVKLLRGLQLEQGGDERRLERAFRLQLGDHAEGVEQRNINAITCRRQNAGLKSATSIAEMLGQTYSYYFDGGTPYAVYGDIPGWGAAETAVRESPEGQAFAPTAYIAARTFPVREKVAVPVKPTTLLRIIKKVDSLLEIKGHEAVGKFVDVDAVKKLEAEYFKKKFENSPDNEEGTVGESVARLKRP